jgi:hypothetical protein
MEFFADIQTAEQAWQTGTPEQRKINFQRNQEPANPTLALEWLPQQTWPQEDANSKQISGHIYRINISDADIPFLESLSVEKKQESKRRSIGLL